MLSIFCAGTDEIFWKLSFLTPVCLLQQKDGNLTVFTTFTDFFFLMNLTLVLHDWIL